MPDHTLVRDQRTRPARTRSSSRGLHVGLDVWGPAPTGAAPFRPGRSEPARRVRALVTALAGQAPQTVVTSHHGSQHGTVGEMVHLVAVPARHRDDLPLLRTLTMAAGLAAGVDVVHVHLRRAAGLATLAALVTAVRRPVVVHLHGSVGVPLRTGDPSSLRSRLIDGVLESRILVAADAVVVPSAPLAAVAGAAGARRVEVIPPAPLTVTGASLHRPLAELAPGRRMVSVGALTARRYPEMLVRSLALQPPDTHLLLLGDGPRRLGVDREARWLGLTGRVHVVPNLTWQLVTDHLAHADVVTSAALSGEDVTVPLLAMAAGRPVVATAVEGLPAVISDEIDGVLVPPGDQDALDAAIRSMLSDRGRAERLGGSARRRTAASGWATHAERVRALAVDVATR